MTKDSDILSKYGGRTAGELLKDAREQRNLSIEQIEEALKIKARHIEAIEYDDHDELPGRVYAIGFIKSYAEYMGFDAEELVELFKMTSIGRHTNIELPSHGDVMIVSQTPSPIIIIVCIVALCGFGIFIGNKNSSRTPDELALVPEVPQDLADELAQKNTMMYTETEFEGGGKVDPPVQGSKPSSSVKKDGADAEIVIKAVYDSWIKVSDKTGRSVYAGILQMGRSYKVPKGEDYTLMTGNSGGTEIIINGKSIGTLGTVSQVRKNIKLSEKSLSSTKNNAME
jgi:cytoskeletal protein RodZ